MSDNAEQFSPEAIAEYRARRRPDSVILMAGGPQRRWPGPDPKHLAPIGGETVIGRLLRQLEDNGTAAPVVVAETPLPDLDGITTCPCGGGYLDSLLQTRAHWRGRVMLVSADTVFSETSMRAILAAAPAPGHAWAAFGKRGANAYTDKAWSEIYALRFSEKDADRLAAAVDDLRQARVRRRKLHELYRVLAGLHPADRPYLPPGPLFHDVPDWTDDIDSRRDHEMIVKYLEENPERA